MAQPGEHHEREHFFGKLKTVAGLTVVSRVFGMIRDIAIASLGATRATGAFVMAFQIPNLFRRLFGEGALAAAFVPTFTETAEQDGFARAARLFTNAFALLGVFLLLVASLTAAGILIWGVFFPGAWDRQLLLRLTLLMLPFLVTICLLALAAAALNCRGHFGFPAFAPILLNLFIITAAWFIAPRYRDQEYAGLHIIAASVTIAGFAQVAAALWLLWRSGFPLRFRLKPIEPGIRPMLRLMGPMILGLGFLQFAEFLQTVIAWVFAATEHAPRLQLFGWEVAKPLSSAALMRLYAARRLYQFPLGVLAISLGVVVFPLLSRYAARGDMPNLRDSLNRALRLATMESLAAGIGLLVLAGPIMEVIFQYRRFTPTDTAASAHILRLYALGMWAYCTTQIFLRAFYALKDTRTPLLISCAMMVVNLVLVLALIWVPGMGAGGFGLATAVSATLNAVALAALLRRRLGRFGGRELLASTVRSAVAGALMAGAILALRTWLEPASGWLIVAVCVPVGAGVFVLAARLLGAPELGELAGSLRKRGRARE